MSAANNAHCLPATIGPKAFCFTNAKCCFAKYNYPVDLYQDFHYAECRYSENRYAECCLLKSKTLPMIS